MLHLILRFPVGIVAFFAALLCVASLLYPEVRGRRMNSGDLLGAGGCGAVAALGFLALRWLA